VASLVRVIKTETARNMSEECIKEAFDDPETIERLVYMTEPWQPFTLTIRTSEAETEENEDSKKDNNQSKKKKQGLTFSIIKEEKESNNQNNKKNDKENDPNPKDKNRNNRQQNKQKSHQTQQDQSAHSPVKADQKAWNNQPKQIQAVSMAEVESICRKIVEENNE
jgi:hypothetical protein